MKWEEGSFGLTCINLWMLKSMLAIKKQCEELHISRELRNEACRILCLSNARYSVDILDRPLDDILHRIDLSPYAYTTSYNIEKKLQNNEAPDESDIVDIVGRWEDLRRAAQ